MLSKFLYHLFPSLELFILLIQHFLQSPHHLGSRLRHLLGLLLVHLGDFAPLLLHGVSDHLVLREVLVVQLPLLELGDHVVFLSQLLQGALKLLFDSFQLAFHQLPLIGVHSVLSAYIGRFFIHGHLSVALLSLHLARTEPSSS